MSDIATNLMDSYRNYFTEIGETISSVKNNGNDAGGRITSVALKAMGLLCLYWGVSGAIGFVANLPILSLWAIIKLMSSIFMFVMGHDAALFGKNLLERDVDPTAAGVFWGAVQAAGAGWSALWNGENVDQAAGRGYLIGETIILKYLV